MLGPEQRGHNQGNEVERERKVRVELTNEQVDALVLAATDAVQVYREVARDPQLVAQETVQDGREYSKTITHIAILLSAIDTLRPQISPEEER